MRRQLDYILVRRKWRKSILNAESYSTFDSVGSDHRVVAARLRLSLRVPKSARGPARLGSLRGSPELQANYTAERLCGADTGGRGTQKLCERGDRGESGGAEWRQTAAVQHLPRIKGEELMEKVKKVETVHGERRYKESWKVINEMSGRKRSRRDSWQAAAQRRGPGRVLLCPCRAVSIHQQLVLCSTSFAVCLPFSLNAPEDRSVSE
ncbi:hypothetical protein AAFF_G00004210 [Aldrovandia affinis]|uniref:Uncharacterized protein n=1 Tax=Aldrovandia affinis TaxID=143900 RepID=A0AAD7TDF0_9TELE|nr:hypothetical protein AAFF_G00004210 [Aldrovandia affinis]